MSQFIINIFIENKKMAPSCKIKNKTYYNILKQYTIAKCNKSI